MYSATVVLYAFLLGARIVHSAPSSRITPRQLGKTRVLASGATVVPIFRTGSITDLETGQFNEALCTAHMQDVERRTVNRAMSYFQATGSIHQDLAMTPEQLREAFVRLGADNGTSTAGNTTAPAAGSSNGTTSLTDVGPDLLWKGPVLVGTPPKEFQVDFDTGSSDFFLASDKCPAAQCAGKNLLSKNASSTAVDTGKAFSISFGDGSAVNAEVLQDTVSIGGISIPNTGVGQVTQLSPSFTTAGGDTSDGLMGLAFPVLSESGQAPFLTSLATQNPQQGMISFKFVGRNAPGSEMTTGGVDTNAFTGSISFAPVLAPQGQPASFYTIQMGTASVENKPVATTSQLATIDTGTSVIIAPLADAQVVYAAVPGSAAAAGGMFTFPCATPPNVALSFMNQTWPINPADMSLGSTDATNKTCVGAIIGSNNRGAWLVGDTFLKNVYSVFDQANPQVGFAKLA